MSPNLLIPSPRRDGPARMLNTSLRRATRCAPHSSGSSSSPETRRGPIVARRFSSWRISGGGVYGADSEIVGRRMSRANGFPLAPKQAILEILGYV
jgi:hypothetical protein